MARMFQTPRRLEPKGWEQALEARGERVSFSGGLSALRWGDGALRALLMHGWEGRATQFEAFVDPLVARGFEVVALDGPAHGRSCGERANPFLFAEAMLRAQDDLGASDVVIGHSMGGGAAMWAVTQGLEAKALAVLGAPASMVGVLERAAGFIGLSEAATRAFLQEMERATGHAPVEIGPQTVGGALGSLPGMLVHAPEDREVPFSDAVEMEAHWPGARLREAPGLGHRRVMRDPEVAAEVARFLASAVELP